MDQQPKRRDHIAELEQWAAWGEMRALSRSSRPDWSAVDELIEAVEPLLVEHSKALRELLEQSRGQLGFCDPLLDDLAVHRWLEKDREESYSDWLAWVLDRLNDSSVVLSVLGVRNPVFVSKCTGQRYCVEREAGVKEGCTGSNGRVDLVVHFGEPEFAVLGVEVKTEDENYEKQRGYRQSLRGVCRDVECVLVANREVPEDRLFGFKLQTWEELSIELRRAIAKYVESRSGNATSAMMLGFVAAIEQNLLGYGTAAPRRAWENRPVLLPVPLFDHLNRALEDRNDR